MGLSLSNMYYAYVSHPDTVPDFKNPPTFDPLVGFPNGRKERTVMATREELDLASIPLKKRDYCVDYFMALMKCRDDHFPRVKKHCSHHIHAWEHCQEKDTILRVKEFERERRMKERAKRIEAKRLKEEIDE